MAGGYELESGSGLLELEDGTGIYGLSGFIDGCVTYSDDDGRTWSTVEVTLTNAHSVTGNASLFDGLRVIAGLRFVSGSSAPCNIVATRANAGEASMGSEYLFKDSASANIEFEDESFHIYPAYDGSARWILTAKAYGETQCDEWESFDGCQTWQII